MSIFCRVVKLFLYDVFEIYFLTNTTLVELGMFLAIKMVIISNLVDHIIIYDSMIILLVSLFLVNHSFVKITLSCYICYVTKKADNIVILYITDVRTILLIFFMKRDIGLLV